MLMLAHLGTLIPRKRLAELLRKGGHGSGDRIAHSLGAVPGEWRPVLCAGMKAAFRKRG